MKRIYLLLIVIALVVSGCSSYRDLDLNKVKVGMSNREVRKAIGRNSMYLSMGSGQTSSEGYSAKICMYGKNRLLIDNERGIVKFNSDADSKQERYLLFFLNDELVYIKWGKINEWPDQSVMDAFVAEMKAKQKISK